MQLIEAKCGLTNYYVEQVIRNNALNLDSTTIDALVAENINGCVSAGTMLNAAALSGGLTAQPTGWANIAGGWSGSNGLMMLKFVDNEHNAMMMEYTNVIGYIHSNDAEGLSSNAIFVPQFSWRTTERAVGGLTLGNTIDIKRTISERTDYLMNDGTQTNPLVTLRPNDVLDYAANHCMADDISRRIEEEGLDGMTPTTMVSGTDISRVGVVPSRRANLNPSAYAGEILETSIGYQRRIRGYNGGDHFSEQGYNDGVYGELATSSQQLGGREPRLARDAFFRTMNEVMGKVNNRHFTGFTIADLDFAFPNFNDVLDLSLYDASAYSRANFNDISPQMGTAQIGEFVSQEIMMNIMDLMIRHDLSAIKFRGSNCDHQGDGHLSNVVLVPYDGFSLKADDFELGSKMEQFVWGLSQQIFVKLNGVSVNNLTPIRVDVQAELFGSCTINIQLVDGNTISQGFQMGDAGDVMGMVCRAFPTFAINAYSSILGTSETAIMAGANQMTNINQYFS